MVHVWVVCMFWGACASPQLDTQGHDKACKPPPKVFRHVRVLCVWCVDHMAKEGPQGTRWTQGGAFFRACILLRAPFPCRCRPPGHLHYHGPWPCGLENARAIAQKKGLATYPPSVGEAQRRGKAATHKTKKAAQLPFEATRGMGRISAPQNRTTPPLGASVPPRTAFLVQRPVTMWSWSIFSASPKFEPGVRLEAPWAGPCARHRASPPTPPPPMRSHTP